MNRRQSNKLRNCFKGKISGVTINDKGRQARDVMLGLTKTCRKLGISFFTYLGHRLGLNAGDQKILPLAELVASYPESAVSSTESTVCYMRPIANSDSLTQDAWSKI